jgi:hypothetical protein
MAVAANPYARLLSTAQGELFVHANADPPSHPLLTSGSLSGLSLLLHVVTGLETDALPLHAHDVLQQSQYRVEWPAPEAARMLGMLAMRGMRALVCISIGV